MPDFDICLGLLFCTILNPNLQLFWLNLQIKKDKMSTLTFSVEDSRSIKEMKWILQGSMSHSVTAPLISHTGLVTKARVGTLLQVGPSINFP